MVQSVFLRVVKRLGVIVMQISGLWPFSYDSNAKKFKFLWYYTILPLSVIGYPLFIAFYWSQHFDKEVNLKKNSVVLVLSIGFLVFSSMNLIILFVSQYFKFHEIQRLIIATNELIDRLNNELDSSEFQYGTILMKFVVKFVFFMSVLIYSVAQSMERYSQFETDYVMHLMSALPNIIMKLHPDIFYAALISIQFYLTQINHQVSSLLTKAKELSENNDLSEQRLCQRMVNFCALSDKLDRLCVLQCSLIEICDDFFRICSFQITLWIALSLIVFLVNLFQEYVSISASIMKDEFSSQEFIDNLIGLCFVISEIYITSSLSDCVMTESRKTGILLNMPLLRHNMDVRFKRSVEIYSNQVLLKSLHITGMGLFPLDSSLMYSFVSTTTSYLVILIQFELKSSSMPRRN